MWAKVVLFWRYTIIQDVSILLEDRLRFGIKTMHFDIKSMSQTIRRVRLKTGNGFVTC